MMRLSWTGAQEQNNGLPAGQEKEFSLRLSVNDGWIKNPKDLLLWKMHLAISVL